MRSLFAAALLCLATVASADVSFSLRTDSGQSCAKFRGSFDADGYIGAVDLRPITRCIVTAKGESRCTITNLPKPFLPSMTFNGGAKVAGDFLVVEADGVFGDEDAPLRLRVICSRQDGCFRLQAWNLANFIGFACDIHEFKEAPKAPAPKPPPLLRKPDESNKPEPTSTPSYVL